MTPVSDGRSSAVASVALAEAIVLARFSTPVTAGTAPAHQPHEVPPSSALDVWCSLRYISEQA